MRRKQTLHLRLLKRGLWYSAVLIQNSRGPRAAARHLLQCRHLTASLLIFSPPPKRSTTWCRECAPLVFKLPCGDSARTACWAADFPRDVWDLPFITSFSSRSSCDAVNVFFSFSTAGETLAGIPSEIQTAGLSYDMYEIFYLFYRPHPTHGIPGERRTCCSDPFSYLLRWRFSQQVLGSDRQSRGLHIRVCFNFNIRARRHLSATDTPRRFSTK